MSQQPKEDWRKLAARLIEKATRKELQAKYGPLKRCYRGHLYTPETQGSRQRGGYTVRKCLVCAAHRAASKPVPKCGTVYAYTQHHQRGEEPCAVCREAKRQAQIKYRASNAASQRRRMARIRGEMKKLKRQCPRCGSGDVQFCQISRRPHCNDCHKWGRVNFGSDEDAIREWNAELEAENG